MNPSSRTPEGEPNRCPLCGRAVQIEPSRPPGDAPCSFCGNLLWFASAGDLDFAEMPHLEIRLRFYGGCRDGWIFASDLKSLAQTHGYRYCLLALHGRVGTSWREVPKSEYGEIAEVLQSFGSVHRLSDDELREIISQLQHVNTHVYQVTSREGTQEEVTIHLEFTHEDVGI